MSRPGQEGGTADAPSIPGVLGLYHADGSPLTLEQCRTWGAQARREEMRYRTALEALLKEGAAGDPFERAALVEGFWMNSLRYQACRSLTRLARSAFKVQP